MPADTTQVRIPMDLNASLMKLATDSGFRKEELVHHLLKDSVAACNTDQPDEPLFPRIALVRARLQKPSPTVRLNMDEHALKAQITECAAPIIRSLIEKEMSRARKLADLLPGMRMGEDEGEGYRAAEGATAPSKPVRKRA